MRVQSSPRRWSHSPATAGGSAPFRVASAISTWNSRSAASRRAKSSPCSRIRAIVSRSAARSDFLTLRAASAATSPSIIARAARRSKGPAPPSSTGAAPASRLRADARIGDEDAGADAHFDAAGQLERDDGFAHGRAGDAEQHRELALGRKPASPPGIRDCRSTWRSARRSAGTAESTPLPGSARAPPRGSNATCGAAAVAALAIRPLSEGGLAVGADSTAGVGIRSSGPTTGPRPEGRPYRGVSGPRSGRSARRTSRGAAAPRSSSRDRRPCTCRRS